MSSFCWVMGVVFGANAGLLDFLVQNNFLGFPVDLAHGYLRDVSLAMLQRV